MELDCDYSSAVSMQIENHFFAKVKSDNIIQRFQESLSKQTIISIFRNSKEVLLLTT